MKKIVPLFLFFLLISCTSKKYDETNHKGSGTPENKIQSEQQQDDSEKITVAYKNNLVSMYSFSEKQKTKLFGTNGEYKDLSICAKIKIPQDAEQQANGTAVKFYLFKQHPNDEIQNSEIFSTVRIPKSFAGQTVKIGICISQVPTGFALESSCGASLSSMSIEKKCIGWNYEDGIIKYSFGVSGGTLYDDFANVDFSDGENCFSSEACTTISLLYQNTDSENMLSKVDMRVAKESVLVRHINNQKKTVIPAAAFANPFSTISLDDISSVAGIIMEENDSAKKTAQPLTCDPGLIIDWNPKKWRNPDYEIFTWEQFPNILIFDTKDYTVQDKIFKRLAFYAEKKGFRGTLAPDELIKDLHAFNAFDYRPKVIADFFNKASAENFPLNEYELLLKDIMLQNGLLTKGEAGTVKPGEGAVISISRELPNYLRWQFINHEGFHGIYFTHKEFLHEVGRVYNSIDPKSLEFIRTYYTISPELNYDIEDTDLVQNELMAYTLQNSLDKVDDYYLNLANRQHVLEKAKPLSDYVKKTKASGFVEIAKELDKFVNENYGLNAGRVYLLSRHK